MGKILVDSDIPDALLAETVVEEMLGLARQKYTLRQFCRVINFGQTITGKIPIGTTLTGQEKVKPLVEAELAAEAYTELDFNLWKNVVHILVPKETQLKSNIDLMKMNVEDGSKDLARMENKQISEEIATFTGIGATATWDNTTGGNPLEDIAAAQNAVANLGYLPKDVVMQTDVYRYFSVNDYVVAAYERGATVKTGHIPAVMGLNISVEYALAAKTAFVVDKAAPAMVLADGPNLVERYKKPAVFADGYVSAQFLEPKKALDDAARQLTACIP